MASMMEFFRGLRNRLYALGAEGQAGADLRQINIVAAGSTIATLSMPGYAIFFAAYDFDRMALATHLALLMTFPNILPLFLLAGRRRMAARIALVLLLNVAILIFSYLYSAQSGTPIFCFATVLIAFLIFDRAQVWLLGGFVGLPVLIYVYAMLNFRTPYPALNLDQTVLDILFIVNSITTFFVIALLTHIFYALVVRAEDDLHKAHAHEAQFAGAVSEYLDPSLVENLRDGADLEPRISHLTVFFSDLVGSTRISFAMEQDEYGRMINAYVHEMQAIIKSAGAYIEDISGDGILGYFGNFESQGPAEDAGRAVSMAREMQSRLADLVPRFKADYNLPEDLYMRIGISSGAAMVGKTPGVRAIYTANGDVVNLGAKLEKAVKEISPVGGILLSEATGQSVGDTFSLGRHQMTVEGETVTAYSVDG